GAGRLHQWSFENGFDVFFLQENRFSGAFAAGLLAGLSAVHDNNTVGECSAKSVEYGAVETISICHEQDDGHNAPGNAEHRHGRPEAMIDESRCGLYQDFFEKHV